MKRRQRKTSKPGNTKPGNSGLNALDIGRLLQPANAFANPMAVVEDQDLTLTEKRAILSAWASDVRGAEPTLNPCETTRPVRIDDVMDALKELDYRYGALKSRPRYRRILERRIPGVFGRKDDADKRGPALR
jgi:hypothetical protein